MRRKRVWGVRFQSSQIARARGFFAQDHAPVTRPVLVNG
jgi:hypothetical protein